MLPLARPKGRTHMSTTTDDIVAILTGGERVRSIRFAEGVGPKPPVTVGDILAVISPKVTVLAMGATERNVGYADEVAYLASQRAPEPLRLHDVAGRTSHLRWEPPLTTISGILANSHRRWGEAWTRRQHARATAASLWYGCPNIILG